MKVNLHSAALFVRVTSVVMIMIAMWFSYDAYLEANRQMASKVDSLVALFALQTEMRHQLGDSSPDWSANESSSGDERARRKLVADIVDHESIEARRSWADNDPARASAFDSGSKQYAQGPLERSLASQRYLLEASQFVYAVQLKAELRSDIAFMRALVWFALAATLIAASFGVSVGRHWQRQMGSSLQTPG